MRSQADVIAALLHDVIEDQEVPREIIAREFGEDVAVLVEEVSDDKRLEKHHRKRIQVELRTRKAMTPNRSSWLTRRVICAQLYLALRRTGWWSGASNTSVGPRRLSRDCAEHHPCWNSNLIGPLRKRNAQCMLPQFSDGSNDPRPSEENR